MTEWSFDLRPQPSMPPLAWVAAVRSGRVRVDHGTSVRTFEDGFVEGTWVGPPDPAMLPEATTVFGSGMVLRDGSLLAVPPSHHLESIYFARLADALVVSNSLPGLLVASGLRLDPQVDYSSLFLAACRLVWLIDEPHGGEIQLRHQRFSIPTTSLPVTGWFVENLVIRHDLSTAAQRRPREAHFVSFADYKVRITAATASLIADGRPYEPVVALSAGYDSAAVAAVAAAAGVRRSLGFATARPSEKFASGPDSGAGTAAALGLEHSEFDRLAYRERTDLPEADLLCTGMAGEDVLFMGFEPMIRRSIFLSGYWGGTEFAFPDREAWRRVSPITTSGAGLTEFRLRADFFNVPLPLFGAIRTLDAPSLLDRPEMDPYRVGGHYDRPIPRRLAEEAGVKRGTFAVAKRAANILLPRDGLDVFTPGSRDSIERFAAAIGERVVARPRRRFSRLERGLVRTGHALRMTRLVEPLEHRRTNLTHFEPRLGNLLLRWSVSVVSERYKAVERV
jgi:hypothetical protein